MAEALYTRSPESFALSPLQTPQQSPDTAFIPVQAGLTGGNFGAAPQAAQIDVSSFQTDTLQSLLKFGEATLAEKVKSERVRQAGEGAIAVMQGATAADLAKNDMFGGFFGDPTAVAAGRQVEKVTQVTKALTSVQERMQDLRKLSPDEFRKTLPMIMNEHMTGDPLSDSLIVQSFVSQTPAVVEHHTKANIEWQQEVAGKQWHDGAVAAGAQYTASVKAHAETNSKVSKETVLKAKADFINALAATTGVYNEKYLSKSAFSIMRQFANERNMPALEAVAESPLIAHLSPEHQAMVPKLVADTRNNMYNELPEFSPIASDVGQVEAWVLDNKVSKQQLDTFYHSTNQKLPGRLDNRWLEQRTKELYRAQAAAAEKLNKTDDKLELAKDFLMTVRRTGEYVSELPPALSKKDVQEGVDALMADAINSGNQQGVLSLKENAMKNGAPLPTVIRAPLTGVLNNLRSGIVNKDDSDTVVGTRSALIELADMYAMGPVGFEKHFGEDLTAVFMTLTANGALTPEKDDATWNNKLQDIANGLRTPGDATRSKEAIAYATNKGAYGALEDFSKFFDPLRGVNVPTALGGPGGDAEGMYAALIANTAGTLAKTSALYSPETAWEVARKSVARQVDRFVGFPVFGNPGLEKPFAKAVGEAMGIAGNRSVQINDTGMYLATKAVLDKALRIDERKANEEDTDYVIGNVQYMFGDMSKIRVSARINGVNQPVDILASEVAEAYLQLDKKTSPAAKLQRAEKGFYADANQELLDMLRGILP